LICFRRYRQQRISENPWGEKVGWAISTWENVDDPGRAQIKGFGYLKNERNTFTVKTSMNKLHLHIGQTVTHESFDKIYDDVYKLVDALNAIFPWD